MSLLLLFSNHQTRLCLCSHTNMHTYIHTSSIYIHTHPPEDNFSILMEKLIIHIDFLTTEWSEVKSLSRVRLCDPMDCSLQGFSVHGIFQAKVLEWVAISFSKGSSWPRDRTQVSCIAGRCFTVWAKVC